MKMIELKNVGFKYPDGRAALENISLSVEKGEFITLCGKSGCGKTTLLRMLKPSISPHGDFCGEILFEGTPLSEIDERKIGFVMQNPENQIVTDKVWHELSFGLENIGAKTAEIRAQVAEMAAFFGIQEWFYEKTAHLSGGQKQILALASVMVMKPQILILDEPTSMLDPIAAGEFLQTLKKINNEFGTTIILSEHRTEEVFAISDRIAVMEKGGIIAFDTPERIGKVLKNAKSDMFCAMPVPVRVFESVNALGNSPVTIRDGRRWLSDYAEKNAVKRSIEADRKPQAEKAAIKVCEAFYRYEKGETDIIKNLNLTVYDGEIFAIFGGNAAGKTTALSLISGINKPQRGKIFINGKSISEIPSLYNGLLGVLPQDPQSLFAKNTVFAELMEMTDKKLPQPEREAAVCDILRLCRLSDAAKSHPYDLSGGEQQRAALAMILLKRPQIVLMDEPTKGMDAGFKQIFAQILRDLKRGGATILLVSHDLEFCAEIADRCALFFDGGVVTESDTRDFFQSNTFYTTAARRMSESVIENAVTCEDIIGAIGGEIEDTSVESRDYTPTREPFGIEKKKKSPKIFQGIFFALCALGAYLLRLFDWVEFSGKNYITGGAAIVFAGLCATSFFPDNRKRITPPNVRNRKRLGLAAFLILLAIPLTIFVGIYYFGDRKYYFISLLIVLETLLPFLMIFEKRHTKAREIVLVSVLCALAVAGRSAFFAVPEFKPLLAIIIISGICMGGETGFLVGAMSGFVSNFFFGHGPWTPWQMFALGIVGFVSGVIFGNGIFGCTRRSVAVFGFFAALVIYGGIMNPASVLMITQNPTKEMIYSAYMVGFPVDLIHAMSTALFLWLLTEPMSEKLARIKTKYGLLEEQ